MLWESCQITVVLGPTKFKNMLNTLFIALNLIDCKSIGGSGPLKLFLPPPTRDRSTRGVGGRRYLRINPSGGANRTNRITVMAN